MPSGSGFDVRAQSLPLSSGSSSAPEWRYYALPERYAAEAARPAISETRSSVAARRAVSRAARSAAQPLATPFALGQPASSSPYDVDEEEVFNAFEAHGYPWVRIAVALKITTDWRVPAEE